MCLVGIGMRSERKWVAKSMALLIGVVYVVVSIRIPYLATRTGWLSVYLPAIVLLFPVMLLLTLYSDDSPWLNLAYFFAGLVIGVSVEALLERKMSGILWLFTSIGFCVLLAPVAVLATAFGRWIRRRVARANA